MNRGQSFTHEAPASEQASPGSPGFFEEGFESGWSTTVPAFPVEPCVNLCEVALPDASMPDLERILAATCREAGFPYCGRVYVGSYFCDNYFLALPDSFFDAVRDLCAFHDMNATLALPIIGQAHLQDAQRRIVDVLWRYRGVFDEIVVNDVACFMDLLEWFSGADGSVLSSLADPPYGRPDEWPRLVLGRLFSKGVRDARYPEIANAPSYPRLSDEALSCAWAQRRLRPGARQLVEVDPTSRVVDVSGMAIALGDADAIGAVPQVGVISSEAAAPIDAPGTADSLDGAIAPAGARRGPDVSDGVAAHFDGTVAPAGARRGPGVSDGVAVHVDVAIHLPFCYATTGRNCSAASIDEPDSRKFRFGGGCSLQCLRIKQDCTTGEGVRYVKHGRTHYFANPACQIAGVDSWRIVYAAGL